MKLIKQSKLLASLLLLFFSFSSLAKAENRYFYQLGYGYVNGNSQSRFTSTPPFAEIIQGYRADFGFGLTSEINKIKVDYILSYSPDAFNNRVDTNDSCPNTAFECRVNIKDSIDLGVKIYLPVEQSNITPAVYLGLSNADIQLKTLRGNGSAMIHQRNWGAAAGASLNYPLKEFNVDISLDYSWTAYERNAGQTTSFAGDHAKARPEIHSTSLKVKKYF